MKRTIVLIILDGWGIGANDASNPIYTAKLEHFPWLMENYPAGSLQASGISVGLPWGEVGNSEVGHLTLGAGKTLYQYQPKISMAIQDGTFFENAALKQVFAHARKNGGRVNLLGLLTKATTHASLDHLQALIQMGEKESVPVHLHLFADGKDGPMKGLEDLLAKLPRGKIATLIGRYYAMDRNEHWELVERAYQCMTGTDGASPPADLEAAIKKTYAENESEEFLPPLVLDPAKTIKDGDAVFFFNFREDSIRETAEAFIAKDFARFPRQPFQNLFVATMTHYRDDFAVPVAVEADRVDLPLAKALSDAGKTQLRLAETYKYGHVTYFFNGHVEEPFKNEYRVLIPSLPGIHHDEHPELQATQITDRLLESIQNQAFDFVLVNYSNPDTIAHTGNYDACIEAAKVMDREIGRVLKSCLDTPTALIITSDHGNLEEVLNPMTGIAETQHDTNPVPVHLVARELKGKKFANWRDLRTQATGVLADVAPTILDLLQLPKPAEMTGVSLLKSLI